jgi:hypothetical protein
MSHEERMEGFAKAYPGPKGDKGDTGQRGEQGLPRRQRRAIVWLFVVPAIFLGVGFLFLARTEHRLTATERQIAQEARSNAKERCASIAQTVGIPVPVPTAGNPSREWVAKFSLIERHRGEQAGCRLPPPRFVTQPPGH